MEFSPLTSENEKLLHKIYYDDKVLFGRDRLYTYIKQKYPKSKISLRGVGAWLRKQKVNQLFQQTEKTKDIKRTLLKEPYSVIGIDLVDMTVKQFGKYKWLLTCIDLFTKKAWAIPLTDKEEKTVVKGFATILGSMHHIPRAVRSDNGSEFISDEFKKLLKKHDIKQILSKSHTPQSNGQIENFNKILKRLIEMDQVTNDNKDWVKTLPMYLEAYNSTPNRVTKLSPDDIEKQNYKDVYDNIAKHINKDAQDKPKFNKGDIVRIKLEKLDFSKSFENWSRELYTIVDVHKPSSISVYKPSYKISNADGIVFKELFYDADLQLVRGLEGRIEQPEKFIISKLIKLVMKNKKPYYLVKWRNENEPTLEPRENLLKDVPKLLAKFEKDNNIRLE